MNDEKLMPGQFVGRLALSRVAEVILARRRQLDDESVVDLADVSASETRLAPGREATAGPSGSQTARKALPRP